MIYTYEHLRQAAEAAGAEVPDNGDRNSITRTWTLYPPNHTSGPCVMLTRQRINFTAYLVCDVLGTKDTYRHLEYRGVFWEWDPNHSLSWCLSWIRQQIARGLHA